MEFEELKLEAAGESSRIRPCGFVRMAWRDPVDGSPQYCRAYLPAEYGPSRKWPMVLYLHGYHAPNPEYYRWWRADVRHAEPADRQGVIYLEPHGRGNTGYLGIGDQAILKVIAVARELFSVDENRIYLTGESMGGWGTWNVASRHPELFAAIAPVFGGVDYRSQEEQRKFGTITPLERFIRDQRSSFSTAESLLNLPIWVWHGDADKSVPVQWSRDIVTALQRWGYDVRYTEVPGFGHEALNHLGRVTPPAYVRHRWNDVACAGFRAGNPGEVEGPAGEDERLHLDPLRDRRRHGLR